MIRLPTTSRRWTPHPALVLATECGGIAPRLRPAPIVGVVEERDARRTEMFALLRRNGFRYEAEQVVCLLCERTVLHAPALETALSLPFSPTGLRLGHHRHDGCPGGTE